MAFAGKWASHKTTVIEGAVRDFLRKSAADRISCARFPEVLRYGLQEPPGHSETIGAFATNRIQL